MISQKPPREGYVPFNIPSINRDCFTYYKIFGNLENRCVPALVILHGGPGGGHEYMLPFSGLLPQYGIPVVFYDHIGCGQSTHLRETIGDTSFWRMNFFVEELENLLEHLNLHDDPGFHLLGQSFGGRSVIRYAIRRPRGLQRIVLANCNASTDLAIRSTKRSRGALPPETQQALDEAEHKKEFNSPAYKNGLAQVTRGRTCRTKPIPEELKIALKNLADDRTVFSTVMGPSFITLTGSILGWTCIKDLPQITAPTLVYNGEYDSATDEANEPFFNLIPRVRWITFADAGHMTHVEGRGIREKVFKIVGDFLAQE